jgi:hypothetical protein
VGRIAISDIVSDEAVPEHLAKIPICGVPAFPGAFQEEEFLRAFEDAKFHGIQIEELRTEAYPDRRRHRISRRYGDSLQGKRRDRAWSATTR